MTTYSAVRAFAHLTVFLVVLTAGCGSGDAGCDSEGGYCIPSGNTLTVNVAGLGTGAGTVSSEGNEIVCRLPKDEAHPTTCEHDFTRSGSGALRLQAFALAGSVFVRWSSGCSRIETVEGGALGEYCYIDYSDLAGDITYTVTAQFDLESSSSGSVTVSVVGDGSGSGTVVDVGASSSGNIINCTPASAPQASCQGTFPRLSGGGTILLRGTPAAGSILSTWVGCSRTGGADSELCYIDYPGNSSNGFTILARFNLAP